jgi:two-component system osmolarity sensor histidine kinase EnvZ
MLKRFLPRSLYGRSLLIIISPLILLQIVSTWIFYDRHWETVTRRLATAVAGEIATAIENRRNFGGIENQGLIFETMRANLELQLVFLPKDILPNVAPEIGSGILDRRLFDALKERVHRPFHLDTWSDPRDVHIKIQLTDGVLDAVVSRERLFSSTTYIFVMWMVGTSLVLFAVAMIFMRNQIRPIRRLADAVENFGKGRDVPGFRPEGATEIRRAAAAFNLMRERIQRTISQRTEMLAGVSHDLRTPLTRMKLQLAMLGDTKAAEELRSDVLEMEKMVEEYLAFSRGEGGEEVVNSDIGDLLREVVIGFRHGGPPIELDTAQSLVVPVRPNAFKRSVTNLVNNAAIHADRIAISAAWQGNMIVVIVDDDGPGIPENEREEVFKPFYRLDSSRNPETGGTGLGLTIARDLIRGHGGDILLEQSPEGGLRAKLRLPA